MQLVAFKTKGRSESSQDSREPALQVSVQVTRHGRASIFSTDLAHLTCRMISQAAPRHPLLTVHL